MTLLFFKQFPFFKQYDVMDCGPTCIRIIAKYYGKNYGLQFLREKCNIGKLGVSMFGISKAAELIGFKATGVRINYLQLKSDINLPCIAHWDQNHFVVIYKITKNKVYISNPDKGLMSYTISEFKKHWFIDTESNNNQNLGEGVILILEPTEKFYEMKSVKAPNDSIRELFKYFNSYKTNLTQILIALIVGSIFQLIFPFLTQSIVDIGVLNKDIDFIYLVLVAQLILFTGQFASDFFRNWLLLYMSTKINFSILSDFVTKLMRVPISFFDVKLTGDIIQRMNDHKKIETFLTGSTLNTVFSLLNILIFGIAIFIYSRLICLIYAVFSLVYITYVVLFLKKRKSVEGQSMEISSTIQGNSLQLIYGIQDIRLNNAETSKGIEWGKLQGDLFKINIRKLKIEQWQAIGAFFINQSKNIFITFYTAKMVITNQMTIGEMLACQFIIGQLNAPLEQLIHFMLVAQDARLALSRIKEINQIEDEEPLGKFSKEKENSSFNGKNIIIKNLCFSYPGINQNVLTNINVVILAGKVTAIVGNSGSGKTTFVKLLLKIYNPSSGNIMVGDIPFSELSPTLWRSRIGTVMQDGFIFSDSIEKNIAIGDNLNSIDESRLKQAIKIANLTDILHVLPNGLKTKIGSEGMGLSQGQKQRILIARAVYKNPDVLFLDEATNALDANNESRIITEFHQFFKKKTVIIVAHRLSTVKDADQILVLNKGEIVEIGNHLELIQKKGYYYKLVKNQISLELQ